MIRKDMHGDWWFNDGDDEHDAINLTELFGKGKEPSESELLKLIREKQKWFQ